MYLTQTEYTDITGDPTITNDKLEMASYLLDSRLGIYCGTDEFKLDIDALTPKQTFAVQHWVAYMAKNLKETGGSVKTDEEGISLGRFSVDRGGTEGNAELMPDSVKYYDQLLLDTGLINRRIRLKHDNFGI